MKKTFQNLLLVATLLATLSCENNLDIQNENNFNRGVSFVTNLQAESRAINNQFENGDLATFDAYTADGDLYADNVSYTYNNGIFSSSTPISYSTTNSTLTFVGCYPKTQYLAKSFTYATTANQSSESSYEGNDFLITKVALSQDLKPTVTFSHVMSYLLLTIENSSQYSDIKISAKNTVLCNTESMSFTASGSNAEITPLSLGNDQYLVLVAPQTVGTGDKFVTATLNGVNYSWKTTSSTALQSGYKYEVTCNLEEDLIITPTDTYRTGWAELPNEPVDAGNYYYAHHTVTLGDDNDARNFSACYSNDYTCPVWVAGPYHPSYCFGSGDRKNNYTDDPQIDCYQVETLGSPYNRGHMIASSDRLGNQALNNQAFYLSNIAPQLITGFNTGGGIWNNYEDEIQEWYQSRTDTLYLVNGCNWENTKTVVNSTTVPTHYYKALLRCKQANSSKSVMDCSSSELECVAFYMEHKSQAGVQPSASHMISIEELEKKTGFTFFSNVPNAPKSSYTASDWGL
ncbi:MAG: DNA/RNA non-specific endonuclease [Rikenellaceae bacterium]